MASSGSKVKVYQRKDGRYYARYFVTFPNGIRKRQTVYGRTKAEAKEKYDKEVANAILGNPLNKNNLTVSEYLNQWIETAHGIKESTRAGYRGVIRKHINPYLGKIRLSSLTHIQVQYMMDTMLSKGVNIRTTHICRNILSKALRSAESRNMVTPNIMRYVELEQYIPKTRDIWDEEEAKKFATHAKDNKYYLFFMLYMTYGLRRGEAIPLRWCDIQEDTIHIHRQYTIVDNKPTLCSLKTACSDRFLPIVSNIQAILNELAKSPHSDNDLLISDNGDFIKPVSVNWEFDKLKKELGLSEVTLHSLRHFAATGLKNAGATIKDAQMILGHSSPETTIKFYQHSSLDDKRKALQKYAEKMQF